MPTCLLWLLIASLQGSSPAPPPITVIEGFRLELPVEPPSSWPTQGFLEAGVVGGSQLRAKLSLSTHAKQVRLRWMFGRDGSSVLSDQTIHTAFWPTAVGAFHGSLIVAGKRRNLNTRIERWQFTHGQLPEGDTPYAPSFTSEVLYDANSAGRRRVRFLEPVQNPAGIVDVLVHFGDSNDVYQLNVESKALTLVISGQQMPLLGSHYFQTLYCIDHPTLGYTYVYSVDPSGPSIETVFLFDGDRDGLVESAIAVESAEEWNQLLGDPVAWLAIHDG